MLHIIFGLHSMGRFLSNKINLKKFQLSISFIWIEKKYCFHSYSTSSVKFANNGLSDYIFYTLFFGPSITYLWAGTSSTRFLVSYPNYSFNAFNSANISALGSYFIFSSSFGSFFGSSSFVFLLAYFRSAFSSFVTYFI